MLGFLIGAAEIAAATSAGSFAGKSANVHQFPPYEGWRTHTWMIILFAEMLSLYCILQLWRKRTGSVMLNCAKSVLLLAPILGPLIYYFVTIDPVTHPNTDHP